MDLAHRMKFSTGAVLPARDDWSLLQVLEEGGPVETSPHLKALPVPCMQPQEPAHEFGAGTAGHK